ncbi:MAG: VOC family protein [Ideonella sp.]
MLASPSCRLDHLVVAADNLEQGASWCLETLGVVPLAGGRHPLMATHNRLLKLDGEAWPDAYLEIIAIDPLAAHAPAAGRSRWFGLDDPKQRRLIGNTPSLVHFVARSNDLMRAHRDLKQLGEDVGEIVPASRPTPDGELRWKITVRADGRPQYHGALPTLIEWQGMHPATKMASSGVALLAVKARSARPLELQRAWSAVGLNSVQLEFDALEPALEVVLQTPLGVVTLRGGFD